MAGDRATTLSGMWQRVTLGASSKVLGAGKYSISGLARKTIDVSEFGVDIDIFDFASADGGTISMSDMSYDPTDPNQEMFVNNCKNGVKFINSTTSGIRFWLNSTSYMTIGTSGTILITSAGKVDADRNGVAKTSFEGKVSGAFMMVV
jgi:hypothetical protein